MTPDIELIRSVIPGPWRLMGETAVRQLDFFGIERLIVFHHRDGYWRVSAEGLKYPHLAADTDIETALRRAVANLLSGAESLRKEITP